MSGYFDLRAEAFRRAFRTSLPYREYLEAAEPAEQAAWGRAEARVPALPPDAAPRIFTHGRRVNVLCLSGAWCGDCVRSVPILEAVARAAGPDLELRILDRDALPELRDELRILGAMRVPVVVFLTEDFHEIGRYGDRPLVVYRDKAARETGAACPVPGAEGAAALAAEMDEWIDLFERVVLMARLAPALRARHGD